MPWVCEPCREYTTDEADKACPTCAAPRKFTLLCKPGDTPDALAGVATTVQDRYGNDDHQAEQKSGGVGRMTTGAWATFLVPAGVVVFVVFRFVLKRYLRHGDY